MKTSLKDRLRPLLSPRLLLFSHTLRGIYAAARYGFPSRGMLVIGVTGTKGKTTTCHFITSILEEAGYVVGMATTADFKIADKYWLNETNKTVVSPMQMQRLLRQMRDAHCDALVLEVTSIGLMQARQWGVPFKYAGLTNMAHDHLDYHKTWENYRLAKLRLFTGHFLRAIAINADDASAEFFLSKTTAKERWSYSLQSGEPCPHATDHIWAEKITTGPSGAGFMLCANGNQAKVSLALPGTFSIENALCAAALCFSLNLKISTIAVGLTNVKAVPGRLEKLETRKGFTVMIDYAHTPDSLEKLYSELRNSTRGRLIAVLGSTGDRDRTKRPIMGALAARFCDYVFVTDEEPYTEDPLRIIEEVAKGVPRGRPLFKSHVTKQLKPLLKKVNENGEGDWWWKIPERREAISQAIDLAKLDDLVVVTGMGAQTSRYVGHTTQPWSERAVIEELLTQKGLV